MRECLCESVCVPVVCASPTFSGFVSMLYVYECVRLV